MYLSDYGYASSNCENKKLYDTNSSSNDIRACNGTNWLYNIKANEWLLPQYASYSNNAFIVISDGFAYYNIVYNIQFAVRPVLYLISSAQITGGNGTSSSPYTLGLWSFFPAGWNPAGSFEKLLISIKMVYIINYK